jgi:putative ABC transport system ATP-binding protein/lipoprotein-releasing system ATP-binding protein
MAPQIELSNVAKHYDLGGQRVDALQSVTLGIEKGEFLSIVGHSGSGKTTLLSVIGGILSPTEGRMTFDGTDVYALGDDELSEYRARNVGYVFQFASLMPVLTSLENLLLPTIFKPGQTHPRPEDEARALDYLALVGLADKAHAYPSQLSGGQQRRVAIARSLMNEPGLLLADEPTGDLDEATEAEVMDLFMRINRERGITFVLVTHSLELASYATRRIKMTQGKVVVL